MSKIEFVQIEPTTRCNFKCAFCPRHHLERGDMEYALFRQALKTFPDMRFLQLYGEGEPLLHPLFFSMVADAVEKGVTVSTITNGSLLRHNLEQILQSGLRSVHVSLESVDPETFHKIRGGDLPGILQSLKQLGELKKAHGAKTPHLGFSVTVLRETRDGLDRIFETYQDLGMDGGIILQPLNEMSSYAKNYDETVQSQGLDNSDLTDIDRYLEQNARLQEIQQSKKLDQTYFEALRSNFVQTKDGCPWLKRGAFVNFRGHVMPCSMVKGVERYSFGQVGKDSLEAMLQKREAMRKWILSGDIPEACRHCRTLDARYRPGKMHKYLDARER